MPKLMNVDATEVHKTLSNFNYSAVEISKLEGSEYTIVQLLIDESSSVSSFQNELTSAIKVVVDSCQKSPRSENLLMRVATFGTGRNSTVHEIHGFTLLSNINKSDYDGQVAPMGMTPLYDATLDAVESLSGFGKQLSDQDYFCNGIFFVVTDGWENASRVATTDKIKNAIAKIRVSESLESVKAILIGVNDTDSSVAAELKKFRDEVGFDEYISVGEATAGKLAKLAQWVSHSISSTSQALGTGGASQPVSFSL